MWKFKQRIGVVPLILIGGPLIICGCLLGVVLVHDYAYKLDKSIKWSDFSSIDKATEVKAILDENLIINQATSTDVVSFLAQKGVEDCTISESSVVCWTPAHESIINPKNLLDIRGYNLLTSWDYWIRFQFNSGKLARIEVSKESTGP
ncbi:MAG TPA: hypothetical protein VHP83_06185 [Aggregatilineaceae bacterium]|nr:hypothetical protein [Aggregatilineaceae bacterium]